MHVEKNTATSTRQRNHQKQLKSSNCSTYDSYMHACTLLLLYYALYTIQECIP